MSVEINNSPVHSDIIITYPYGVSDSGYSCGWHTGIDFAPTGTTENNPIMYPVKKGKVVYLNNTTNVALGVQVQILDDEGHYWRYCHMVLDSIQVSLNQEVDINTPLGRMGSTGNVTGRHLHLECSTTQNWQCSTFLNPTTILNIPNEKGVVIKYNGEIPPTPPTPSVKFSNSNKWLQAKNFKINIKY